MNKAIALYDDHCFLCRQTKKMLQPLDWFGFIKWQPLEQFVNDYKISYQSAEVLKKEIHIVTYKKEVKKGFEGMSYLFQKMPLLFPLGLVMNLPGASLVGAPIYRWIARNRYRLFKARCESSSCSIS
ncbi:thiol-disulfide oxidoreductase DCC family protein [Halobacillus massiliensis]|uniref:thiol-disulfide oxidoreductase DCC family protein n=1 Tax=Halobacillus massiliensis TaxID=1926286 RepID=UPI0015C45A89|nr:DUF393 domain-containing protein [Halobacillus massiliensis]